MADLAIPALQIVGWEGVFGTAMMVFILLPIVYFLPGMDGGGLHENSIETLHVSASSQSLHHFASCITTCRLKLFSCKLHVSWGKSSFMFPECP